MKDSVYSPGAGHAPPVLAGRDELLDSWRMMLADVASMGRLRAEDTILVGPRGVGKTVTMAAFAEIAESKGFDVVSLQSSGGQAGLVPSLLHEANDRIESGASVWRRLKRVLDQIAGVSFGVAGVSASVSKHQTQTVAPTIVHPGTLAGALATLALDIQMDHPTGGLMVCVDEIQSSADSDLALIAAVLHQLNGNHRPAPVVFAATGLPKTLDVLAKAKVTHAERLFYVKGIPVTLPADAAKYAVVEPAARVGVVWDSDAADLIVAASKGYPAHLQVYAHHTWRVATGPAAITFADAQVGIEAGRDEIVSRALAPRWERMTDRRAEYTTAIALCGGEASTSTISAMLGRSAQEISWIREQAIAAGDVCVPQRGRVELAFPAMADYAIANYSKTVSESSLPLVPLEEMQSALDSRTGKEPSRDVGFATLQHPPEEEPTPGGANLGGPSI